MIFYLDDDYTRERNLAFLVVNIHVMYWTCPICVSYVATVAG